MSSIEEGTGPLRTLRDEVADLAERAHSVSYRDELNAQFMARILDTVVATAEQTDDCASVKTIIQQHLQDIENYQTILQEILKRVDEVEVSQARQEQYSERWLLQRRHALYEMFQSDPQHGLSSWIQTYAAILLAWNVARCAQLVNEQFPFPPQPFDIPALFQTGTQALIDERLDERYQQALDMLMYLVEATSPDHSQHILDQTSRATLHIFIGRILLYKASDSETALKHFEQARELAPDEGRPRSALGEYFRLKSERDKALSLFQEAIRLSPKLTDGYIGKGLVYEDQELWDEADDCYEEAIGAVAGQKDIEAAFNKFLAPISGNLYLQLARTFKKNSSLERALQAVKHAIDIGIKDQGGYPERIGYRLKGEILELLERRTEAAEAYFEAGRRFSSRDEHTIAAEILTHAKELNSRYIPIYWQLSDTLRLSSYQKTPPYVDQELIKRSLATWEQGYTIELPDSDYIWAYVLRAFINEQLARLPNADEWALWWEAIAYIERYMLLNKTDYRYLSFLGRYYRFLEIEANALLATSKAMDYDPTDPNILDERAGTLADAGELDAAEEVVVKRQMLEANTWIDAVKAYVLIHKSLYKEALEILQRSLQAEPNEIWYHDLRALCYLMLDEPQSAREEYEWIWNHYKGIDSADHIRYGWAAYNLGKTDEAIEIFNKMRNDQIGIRNIYWNLGLCYLTRGDLSLGEEYLERGIAYQRNVQQIDDLLNVDLYILELSSANWPHSAQVHEVLVRIKEKLETRRNQVKQKASVEEELKEIIKKYPFEEGKINWPWIGAHASLARIYTEQKRWPEVASIYQLLLKEEALFPEARLGLQNMLDNLQKEGDICLGEGQFEQAIEHFSQSLTFTLKSPGDNTLMQADLHSRFGFIYLNLADLPSARTHFSQALQLYRQHNTSSLADTLGDVYRSLLKDASQYWKDASHYWRLEELWNALLHEQEIDEHLHSDLIAARRAWKSFLDDLFQLTEQQDTTATTVLPLPIALEIGEGLIPEDTSPEWTLLKFYIPQMREHFQDEMGMDVPGVLVRRGSTSLPSGGYNILLFENPVLLKHEVPLDRRYCPAAPEKLHALGIPIEDLIQAPHPLTGLPGAWVPPDKYEAVISHDLELWAEPLVYIVYHLEAILRKNLADFWNMQELEKWLHTEKEDESYQRLVASALPDQQEKFFLARVLRALLREQVPILRRKDILTVFWETRVTKRKFSEIVRAVRLRLKHWLPGNQPIARRLELSKNWEDGLATGLEHVDGQTYFTALPRETLKFLSALRRTIPTEGENAVLVIQNAELRPFLRLLVEAEFPSLAVLSEEEVLTPDETLVVSNEHVTRTEGVNTDAE